MDHKQRLEAAFKLLDTHSTSFEKFESVKTLLTDLDPRLNKALEECHKIIVDLRKLQKGDVIELSAQYLPESNEKEKKRKKALLLFIKTWKDLKGEVARVQKELGAQSHESKWLRYGKIVKFAKGPFGAVTLVALLLVGIYLARTNSAKNIKKTVLSPTVYESPKPKIKVIEFGGKRIPLNELYIGQGPDCGNGALTPHYHAKDHTAANATDGSRVLDPGGCGFGKVKDVVVLEVE